MKRARNGRKFWRQGEPLVWLAGSAMAAILLAVAALLLVIAVNGLGAFWPTAVVQVTLGDGKEILGKRMHSEVNPDNGTRSVQFKTANREFDPQRMDFHWIDQRAIRQISRPAEAFVLERMENGDFYGFLRELQAPCVGAPAAGTPLPAQFAAALAAVAQQRRAQLDPIAAELSTLSDRLQAIRGETLRGQYHRKHAPANTAAAVLAGWDNQLRELQAEDAALKERSQRLVDRQHQAEQALRANVAILADGQGQNRTIALADVVRYYQPNAMGLPAKVGHYIAKVWELLTAAPRESNTEGGLFPAIFGTVMLIFLMAISCFPLGVLAGIYLAQYAKEGLMVRLVRVAVNNLAGVPSIVYGIFGLGIFVYGLGSAIDAWWYPERVEAGMPTFGTGGILWASITLGLLTVPVVIVATEEALRAIPRGMSESSLAMGATKFQTLLRVLLPMASPGILTGFILAMARAAGEVAPLMITGVVKLAPSMPLDGTFPFVHLDRKFMYLGFHIYDIALQSPNVEASKPMIYVTTLLLVLIVLVMSSAAIYLRNVMQRRVQLRSI